MSIEYKWVTCPECGWRDFNSSGLKYHTCPPAFWIADADGYQNLVKAHGCDAEEAVSAWANIYDSETGGEAFGGEDYIDVFVVTDEEYKDLDLEGTENGEILAELHDEGKYLSMLFAANGHPFTP